MFPNIDWSNKSIRLGIPRYFICTSHAYEAHAVNNYQLQNLILCDRGDTHTQLLHTIALGKLPASYQSVPQLSDLDSDKFRCFYHRIVQCMHAVSELHITVTCTHCESLTYVHTHMHTQVIVLVLSSVMSVYPAIIKICATVYQLLYVPSFRGKLENTLRIFIILFVIAIPITPLMHLCW